MLKHSDIWQAIDALAHEHGLSPSGLAKRAGLDPTTFNKSKRTTASGKPRWPSTESVAKILAATESELIDFVNFIGGASGDKAGGQPHTVPLIGMAQAGADGFFDDAGYPTGGSWDEIDFPNPNDPQAYALEISGDSMEPVMRDGDVVIVSPGAGVRRGDKVVVKTTQGEVMAKILKRQTAQKIELASANPAYDTRTFNTQDIEWIARILWAAQ